MTAPVSPIATQETDPREVAAAAAVLSRASGLGYTVHAALDVVLPALSSAERRIEELVRERDEARHGWATVLGDVAAQVKTLAALKAEVEELKRERDASRYALARFEEAVRNRPDYEVHWEKATIRAEAAESRIASLTGQAEDAARGKVAMWMIQHSIATGHGDTFGDLLGELSGFVTTLKAEVEELKRRPDMLKQLLDDANAAHFDATMRADAAESRLASLTGQVEDILAAAEPFSVMAGELFAHNWNSPVVAADWYDVKLTAGDFFKLRTAIRSLPVLPTTGDGGGPDIASLRRECASSGFHEHDGCSCSDAELVARGLPRPPVEDRK